MQIDHETGKRIVDLLTSEGVPFKVVSHPPCRTSQESRAARAMGGGGDVVGAKAILAKMSYKGLTEFSVLVLEGDKRIDPKALRRQLPGLKEFRFATPEEMADQTGGLTPGCMPPFARPIFERLAHLYLDADLAALEAPVGFNLACHTQSLILHGPDYVRVARASAVFPFALLG